MTNKAVYVKSKKIHYWVYASHLRKTSNVRIFALCCCFEHFDRFRALIPYPKPPRKPRSRVPVREGMFFCPHIYPDEIKILSTNKYSLYKLNMMYSRDYPRYVIRGARQSLRGSRELWKYFTCMFCYLMARELIEKPMPLSYGYREVVKGFWVEAPYGIKAPPWPTPKKRRILWCNDCLMPTLHDDDGCCFIMHGLVDGTGPYPFFTYCAACQKRTRHRKMRCNDCGST